LRPDITRAAQFSGSLQDIRNGVYPIGDALAPEKTGFGQEVNSLAQPEPRVGRRIHDVTRADKSDPARVSSRGEQWIESAKRVTLPVAIAAGCIRAERESRAEAPFRFR